MASYFPKALWYKEWRHHRGKALLAFCAFALVPVGRVLVLWTGLLTTNGGTAAMVNRGLFWKSFTTSLTSFQVGRGESVSAVVVVLMAAILASNERTQGTLLTALSMPVRRDDWLRTKFLFGIGVILASYTILALWQTGVNFFNPHPVALAAVCNWWVMMFIVNGAIFSVAFFAGVCVTGIFWTVIATVGVLGFPVWLNLLIVTGTTGAPYFSSPWVSLAASYVERLSPVLAGTSLRDPTWVWYLALIPLGYLAAKGVFMRIKTEDLDRFLTLSSLKYWLQGGISVVVGSYFAEMARGQQEYVNAPPAAELGWFWGAFVIGSVLVWLVVYAIWQTIGRRQSRTAPS